MALDGGGRRPGLECDSSQSDGGWQWAVSRHKLQKACLRGGGVRQVTAVCSCSHSDDVAPCGDLSDVLRLCTVA